MNIQQFFLIFFYIFSSFDVTSNLLQVADTEMGRWTPSCGSIGLYGAHPNSPRSSYCYSGDLRACRSQRCMQPLTSPSPDSLREKRRKKERTRTLVHCKSDFPTRAGTTVTLGLRTPPPFLVVGISRPRVTRPPSHGVHTMGALQSSSSGVPQFIRSHTSARKRYELDEPGSHLILLMCVSVCVRCSSG